MSIPPGEAPPERSTPEGDEVSRLRQEPDVDSELTRVIEEFRVIRADLTARLDDEIARSRELKRALNQAERRIESIYESKTWAAGKVLRRLARPLSAAKEVKPAPPLVATEKTQGAFSSKCRRREIRIRYGRSIRLEVAHPPESGNEGPVFMVSTTRFGEGRGDLFVATGLGRYLHRRRFSVGYLDREHWYESLHDAAMARGHDACIPALQVCPRPEGHWLGTERVHELAHPSRAGSVRRHPLLFPRGCS